MTDFLGVSYPSFFLLLAIILLIIDVFLSIDVLTHIAYILFTLVFASQIELAFGYKVILSVLLWFVLVIFHYALWRKFIENINDKYISPSQHISGIKSLIGNEGVIKKIDGKMFIYVGGELHHYKLKYLKTVKQGDVALVREVKKRKIII